MQARGFEEEATDWRRSVTLKMGVMFSVLFRLKNTTWCLYKETHSNIKMRTAGRPVPAVGGAAGRVVAEAAGRAVGRGQLGLTIPGRICSSRCEEQAYRRPSGGEAEAAAAAAYLVPSVHTVS